jgi:isohexenylglutaconyl-CoA hydratase
MSRQMVAELRAALEAAEAGSSVRVVVLRGAGGHFCAGADLKDLVGARMRTLQSQPEDGADGLALDAMAQVNAQFGALCVAYAKTPLALVTVLEGSVMGGGLGLTCVADVALASESAVFRLPETALGVVPAQIAPFLVERLGYSQAKRLAVTGGRLSAAEALAIGLVHGVHGPEQVDDALAAVLADILVCAPGAIAATKALMLKARLTPPEALVQEAAKVFSSAAQGSEGLEGAMAFLQKRKPSWAAA